MEATLLAEQDTKPAAAAPAPKTETPKAATPEASKTPEQTTQPDKQITLLGSEKPEELKKDAAPVAYDLKVPDDSALDAVHIDGLKAFAAANGIDPKVAQAMLDRDATVNAARQQAAVKDWNERQVPEWRAAIKADKELGGANYARTDARSTAALTKFWGAEFMQRGMKSGLVFEPDFVRGLNALGAAMEAGGHVAGGVAPGSSSKADLRSIYPNSPGMFPKSGNGADKE